jgi:hypothetical protein
MNTTVDATMGNVESQESMFVDACQQSLLTTGEYSQVIHTLRAHNDSIAHLLVGSKKELNTISNGTSYQRDYIERLIDAIENVHPMMIDLITSLHDAIKDTRASIAREVQAHNSNIVHPSSLQERLVLERISKLMQTNAK